MDNRFFPTIGNRFSHAGQSEEIINPYDMDSRLLDDLIKRQLGPVHVQTLDLRTASTETFINVAGRAFVLYGHDNSATKAIVTTIYVPTYINQKGIVGGAFPAKHGRGFIGPFAYLTLAWAAQSNAYADLIIFRGSERPWVDGEACT